MMSNLTRATTLPNKEQRMTPQIKYTTLPTGVTVEYIENGALAGTPLLLLHGLSDSWHSFLPLLPHLPHRARALAFTERGHGQSSKPRGDYSLDMLVKDAIAFLDAMHVDRAIIAGHSMGAAVATSLAAAHPERVAGLVLLGAFADFRGNAGVVELRQDIQDLTDPVDPAFARAFQVSTIFRMIDDEFIDLVVSDSQATPSFVWRSLTDALLASDLPAALGKIAAPTCILWGACDVFVPRSDPVAILSAIRGATLRVLHDTGHAVHWDRPGETAAIVNALMQDVAGRKAA
jgi:pimeloyl-ACP methyl ester carboxylesterase